MIITYVPFYCGGRFLAGFHNPNTNYDPGFVYRHSTLNWKGPSYKNDVLDPCPYLPSDFVEFLQILRKFLYADKGSDNFQGVVYAVTNPVQTRAPKYLQDAGFVSAGSFKKGPGQNECVTWIGDYRNKIYPILSKVPDWKTEDVKSKFKPAETVTAQLIPIQLVDGFVVPPQMQNPFRDSAQQVLSTTNVGEGTIRRRSGI